MRADSFGGQVRTVLSRGPGHAPDIATGRAFLTQVRIALARTGTPYESPGSRGGRFGWVFPILLIVGGVLGGIVHWVGLLAGLLLLLAVAGYAIGARPSRSAPPVVRAPEPLRVERGANPVSAPVPRPAGHFVVCWGNALAYRLVAELAGRFGARVTVVLPDGDSGWEQRLRRLPGVRVVRTARVDDAALAAADVADARAVAVVGPDDAGNFQTALWAQEISPDVRLVIRMSDPAMALPVRSLFTDCVLLSDSATAAQAFVAATLGEPDEARLPGGTLCLTGRNGGASGLLLAGLDTLRSGGPRLLPVVLSDDVTAWLLRRDGTAPVPRPGRRPAATSRPALWLAVTLLALFAAAAAILTVTGHLDGVARFWLVIAVDIAVVPMIVAAVVEVLTRQRDSVPRGLSDHVVVVGLGDIGTKVVDQLHDRGIAVVCVESDEGARGVDRARELGVPVVIGDATREAALRAARVATSRAVLSLACDDAVNVEIALRARTLSGDPRMVLRLFDDDLAERLGHGLRLGGTRDPALLAAPGFAAAMVDGQVPATIPLGRDVLVVAEVPAGAAVDAAQNDGRARVIAIRRHGTGLLDWAPAPTDRPAPRDRVVVVATRQGLASLLPVSDPERLP
jgi:Trk K+ transport system NAD-binding subunit